MRQLKKHLHLNAPSFQRRQLGAQAQTLVEIVTGSKYGKNVLSGHPVAQTDLKCKTIAKGDIPRMD
jgi:hypothetical protein